MISHLKRRFGIFTAVAVLGSVCAAVSITTVSPVSAAPATTAITALTLNAPASYSACPASAGIPSAGFTDTTDAAVDCLAYYGITLGTTATTYEPTASVSRWQMALYLTRAHTEAGGTLGTGADQGFTDISGKSAEIQTAINQIAQLGVTVGKTATTFAPDDNVTREEMAMFIERWLTNTTAGPGGSSEADATATTDASITYVNSNCGEGAGAKTCTGTYNYSDIDSGAITVEASLAVKELFTMGIHDGVSATTFSPQADMTRAAMATFMSAALNHTNLRPEGLHMQAAVPSAIGANASALHISYRDASFDPIAAAPIDSFIWVDTLGAEGQGAFTATGLCNASYITAEASSLTECYIDTADPVTDDSGNVSPADAAASSLGTLYARTNVHYAWTDAVATTFDNDTKGSGNKFASASVAASPAADELKCSMDVDPQAVTTLAAHTVKFGDVTTVTCQFMSGTAGGAASEGIAVPLAGKYATLTNTRVFTTDSSTLSTGDTILATSTLALSDANGAFTWTITGPADTTGTDVVTDSVIIDRAPIAGATTGGSGIHAAQPLGRGYAGHMDDGNTIGTNSAGDQYVNFQLIYKDSTGVEGSVGMTQATSSATAVATGVTRTNTATAYDQYGDPTAGIAITFTSASSLPEAVVCDQDATAQCTSLTAHNLTAGDIITVAGPVGLFETKTGGAGVPVGTTFCVGAAVSTVIFTLMTSADCAVAVDSSATNGEAGTAARPLWITEPSFLPTLNSRTTGSAGTATFSWVDTITHATADIVTATTAGSKTTTKTFYRLTTSADFISNTASIGVKGANETCAALVEFDAVGQDYILRIDSGATASASGGQTTSVHKQYTYDANDQFSDTATVANKDGVPDTMATWVVEMATLAATAGTCDDVMEVDMSATPVASIQRHSKQG